MDYAPSISMMYLKHNHILDRILPYYGKLELWKKCLMSLSKESKQVWEEEHDSFKELAANTKYDKNLYPISYLYKLIFGKDVEIDSEFRLQVDLYEENDVKFISEASQYKFQNYKDLSIENVWDDEATVKTVVDFLITSTPEHIEQFSFVCDQYSNGKLNVYSEGLHVLLPAITHSIKLYGFKIDEETFKSVIEGSRNATELSILDCQINISKEFELNPDLEYRTEVLYLHGSCKKESGHYLNPNKLPIFVEALSKTGLKNSIKKVRVLNHQFQQDEVQKVFADFGMDVEVKEKVTQ